MDTTSHFSKIFSRLCATNIVMISFFSNAFATDTTDKQLLSQKHKHKLSDSFHETEQITPKIKVQKIINSNVKRKNTHKKQESTNTSLIRLAPILIQEAAPIPVIDSIDQPISMPFQISDLHEFLNKRIIGQNDAMLSLSTAIHSHYLGVKINTKIAKFHTESTAKGYIPIQKKNILLIGHEGSGKTDCLSHIKDFLQQYHNDPDFNFPIITQNHTSIDPLEAINMSLLRAAAKSINAQEGMEKALILIDDMDQQIFSHNTEKNPEVASGIQEIWAPILQGATLNITIPNENGTPDDAKFSFKMNTQNMLFIATGRFKTSTANLQLHDDSDLENFGFIPEFINSFQHRALLNQFNTKMLTQIINKSDIPFMKSATTFLKLGYDITLAFEADALREIAGIAIKGDNCVHSLKLTVDRLIEPILRRAPTLRGQTLTISKADVDALPRIKSKREKFDEKFPGYVS